MSLKLKLISVVALFTLMLGILIMGVFAATQSINLTGSLNFNIPDRSLYVKDIRIKQDLNEEPVSLEGFMPGYLNSNYTLDLTNVTETNTYSSFTLYFDVINTTESMWEIKNVTLPTILEEQGVFVSGYSGRVEGNSTLTDSDGDSYKEITDVATTTYSTLTISISNPNASAENPLVLDGIVITIEEVEPNITAISTNQTLGKAEGVFAFIGDEVTLTAEFTGEDADFLGWKTSEQATEYISTLPNYTFTFKEDSPTEYYAVFTEPNTYLTYNYNVSATSDTATGEAQLANCLAGATDITVPSAIYRTTETPMEYTITSMYDGGYNKGVFNQTRSTLQSVSLPETLTNIGSYAFYNCSGLTSITIPSSITSFGDSAFRDCNSLTGNLVIPEGVTSTGDWVFCNCSSLTGVTLPSTLTSIGYRAFDSCSGIASIIIPEGVISISDYAFNGCSGLTGELVIPEEVTTIGYYAFNECSNLTSISLPNTLTSIGERAFCNCRSLTSIVIPEGVTSINSDAFRYCSGLTSVSLPNSLTSIGIGVFCDCNNLTSITIPENVTSIGDEAFLACQALAEVYNYSSITISSNTSNGYVGYYAKVIYNNLSGEKPVSKIQTIGDIQYYVDLENGDFIALAPAIARGSLTTLTLDSRTTEINQAAFEDCVNLTSVTIPSSVTSIGSSAFHYCYALAEVYNHSSSITIQLDNTSYSNNGYLGQYAKVVYNASDLSEEKPASKIQVIDNIQYYVDLENSDFIALAPAIARGSLTTLTLDSRTTEINLYAFEDCARLIGKFVIPEGVTSIGDSAFYNCAGIKELILPTSVTSIGASVFYGCDNLQYNVDEYGVNYLGSESSPYLYLINDGTFSSGSYIIKDTCKLICPNAFSNCSGLTSITIPEGIIYIGARTFYYCDELANISIPEGVTSIGEYTFYNCRSLGSVTLPSTLKSIDDYAFDNCRGLTSIVIPEGVTSIGQRTFYNCSSLESVTLPSTLQSIDSYVFYGCSKLASITIPEGVTSIGSSAFDGCSSLKSVTLPSTLKSIDDYAFDSCSGLISIIIPEGVTSIGQRAFYNCSSLESVTLPSTLQSIDSYVFYGCSKLASVTIPEGVTSIESSTFSGCSSLESVTLPSTLTSIGIYAFEDCSNLTSIIIPSNVTSISAYAFRNCSLATIYIDSSTIANGITSSSSYGYLTQNATTLYIKDTITVTTAPNGWIVDSAGSEQVDGYVKYIKA